MTWLKICRKVLMNIDAQMEGFGDMKHFVYALFYYVQANNVIYE